MKKLVYVLLAASLVAIIVGVLIDIEKLYMGAIVFGGCMIGSLIGDGLRKANRLTA